MSGPRSFSQTAAARSTRMMAAMPRILIAEPQYL
jgi:hypothetical protein